MISFHPPTCLRLTITILLTLQTVFLNLSAQQQITCPIEYVYQFGASISDTGNFIRLSPVTARSAAARLPHGETFFRRPTGRYSDGLLIIDFLAAALGLPLLNPYLDKNASFNHGANFAVAGGTALDRAILAGKGVLTPATTIPLQVQLDWFKTFLYSTCPDCSTKLGRALVLVGEIGRNDFNYAIAQGKSVEFVKSYVPDIVQSIAHAVRWLTNKALAAARKLPLCLVVAAMSLAAAAHSLLRHAAAGPLAASREVSHISKSMSHCGGEEVIRLGATRVIVPGSFPTGCFPFVLTLLPTSQPEAYDELGCQRSVNEFVEFQNSHLQTTLASLRQEFPEVMILYADYYSSFLSVLRRAPFLGFEGKSLLRSCCGTGGEYNFTLTQMCGLEGVPVCPNPNRYLHWDGIHLTQEAYRQISNILIPDLLSRIQCV